MVAGVKRIGSKVTDMFVDWAKKDADAQAEAVKRLGLPKNNTAADRAKAIGFSDETYYHGTPWDIHKTGIDFDRVGDNASASHGFHMSNNPAEASSYAFTNEGIDKPFTRWVNNGLGEDDLLPSVTPLKYKANNPAEFTTDYSHASALRGDELQSTIDNANDAVIVKGNNTNKQIEDWKQLALGEHAESIKAKDFDWGDKVNTHVVVNKDALLRSPLAHFNPKMAGVGAGSVMSGNLMADESNTKPTENIWSSLMNTIGGVNQEQAQAYGDTGAGAINIAHMLATDPAVAGEVISTVGLKGIGAVSPYIKGFGVGLALDSGEASAAERPGFFEELQKKRIR